MNHDEFDDPNPDNPFSSPPVLENQATSASVSGRPPTTDGTAFDALAKGWQIAVDNALPLLGILILHQILRIPSDNVDNFAEAMDVYPPMWVYGLCFLYRVFVSAAISVGFSWICLRAVRQERYEVGDLFAPFVVNYWPTIGAMLLKGIAVAIGLLLLIVPGLYLLVRWSFVEYLLIDRKMGVVEAFNESWRMTEHHVGPLFLLMLMSVLISIGGCLACVVGLFWTTIWLGTTYAIFYHMVCLTNPNPYEQSRPMSESDNPFVH